MKIVLPFFSHTNLAVGVAALLATASWAAAPPPRDLSAEIAKVLAEVERDHRIAYPGPWARLAGLYCRQAAREQNPSAAATLRQRGLNLLREEQCARRMKRTLACGLPNWRNEASHERRSREEDLSLISPNPVPWGFVPDTDITPMCFVAFCGVGFQNDEDGERHSTTHWTIQEDPGDNDGDDQQEWINNTEATAEAERACGVARESAP